MKKQMATVKSCQLLAMWVEIFAAIDKFWQKTLSAKVIPIGAHKFFSKTVTTVNWMENFIYKLNFIQNDKKLHRGGRIDIKFFFL